jgi:hypothetical protein
MSGHVSAVQASLVCVTAQRDSGHLSGGSGSGTTWTSWAVSSISDKSRAVSAAHGTQVQLTPADWEGEMLKGRAWSIRGRGRNLPFINHGIWLTTGKRGSNA